MEKIRYDCEENDNYIMLIIEDGELDELRIGTHGDESSGQTVIGKLDLLKALSLIGHGIWKDLRDKE